MLVHVACVVVVLRGGVKTVSVVKCLGVRVVSKAMGWGR